MQLPHAQGLLIDAACEKTTINDEHFAGDETGCIGRQKDCRARKFLDLSKSSQSACAS
jgi:hypothetical protein